MDGGGFGTMFSVEFEACARLEIVDCSLLEIFELLVSREIGGVEFESVVSCDDVILGFVVLVGGAVTGVVDAASVLVSLVASILLLLLLESLGALGVGAIGNSALELVEREEIL